jgi:hypothetical protein
MPTQTEEQQVRDFLKRAEVKTMKKDLRALREIDALKERDKIATIKTLEEQLQEHKTKQEKEAAQAAAEKAGREEILERHENEEKIAEKDLKNYGTEEERQKIFLLESQRLGFEKQVDAIDKEKDPKLKLEKNNLLLKVRDNQTKLDAILADEQKLENEQKFLAEKAKSSTVPAEQKALEQSRWDADKKIQDTEKKRWAVEKQIEDLNAEISTVDKSSEQLVLEKNGLHQKILGIDKSLRDVYSDIIAREEEKRRGLAAEQVAQREAAAKARADKNEQIQRQEWTGIAAKRQPLDQKFKTAPKPIREKIIKQAEAEEEQRKKFLQEVQNWSETGGKNVDKSGQQKSAGPSMVERAEAMVPKPPSAPTPPAPPTPHK